MLINTLNTTLNTALIHPLNINEIIQPNVDFGIEAAKSLAVQELIG